MSIYLPSFVQSNTLKTPSTSWLVPIQVVFKKNIHKLVQFITFDRVQSYDFWIQTVTFPKDEGDKLIFPSLNIETVELLGLPFGHISISLATRIRLYLIYAILLKVMVMPS